MCDLLDLKPHDDRPVAERSPLYLPYISPMPRLYLAYISPLSRLYLPAQGASHPINAGWGEIQARYRRDTGEIQGAAHPINAGWGEAPQDSAPLPGGVRRGAPRDGAPLPGGSNADGESLGAAATGGPASPYAEVPFYTAVRLGSP